MAIDLLSKPRESCGSNPRVLDRTQLPPAAIATGYPLAAGEFPPRPASPCRPGESALAGLWWPARACSPASTTAPSAGTSGPAGIAPQEEQVWPVASRGPMGRTNSLFCHARATPCHPMGRWPGVLGTRRLAVRGAVRPWSAGATQGRSLPHLPEGPCFPNSPTGGRCTRIKATSTAMSAPSAAAVLNAGQVPRTSVTPTAETIVDATASCLQSPPGRRMP